MQQDPHAPPPGDRTAQLLYGISPDDNVIEIGPSYGPIAPRSAGWNVTIVDHDTREGLVSKYKDNPTVPDVEVIEDVDIVWTQGPLHSSFQEQDYGRYRAMIASHVLEHIPDPIAWLHSTSKLLDPNESVISLALPDKRWCFDLFKPVSTTGQVLAAHRAHAQRHSAVTLFHQIAYSAADSGRPGWGRELLHNLRFSGDLKAAKAEFDAYFETDHGAYVDCHAWQFTPASFELLILELGALEMIDWRLDWIAPQPTVEFTAQLRRGRRHFASAEELDAVRMRLLKQILLDLREQSDWMISQDSPEAASELRLANLEERLNATETALAALQTQVRPIHSALESLLPARSAIARLRGRSDGPKT